MLGGAGLLVFSALFGEMQPFPHISLRGGLALLYLIVCGSLLGFTAFVWLLARMPATLAVALGYFVAGEAVTLRTLIGSVLVIARVFLILRNRKAAI